MQPQPTEPGGCPFTSSREEELSALLHPVLHGNLQLLEKVIEKVQAKRPTAACKVVLAYTIYRDRQLVRKQHSEQEKNQPSRQSDFYSSNHNNDVNDHSILSLSENEGSKVEYEKQSNEFLNFSDSHNVLTRKTVCSDNSSCIKDKDDRWQYNHSRHKDAHSCSKTSTSMSVMKTSKNCCRSKNYFKETSEQNCPSFATKHKLQGSVCDIEDLSNIILDCSFLRPSQYFSRARHNK